MVIEGLDGSGKTTQLKLLEKYLVEKKIKTVVFDFPQYYQTFFGKLVGCYLKGEFGKVDQVSPYLASLTFSGDRWQAKPLMEKALREGKLILTNRYTTSNMAFMGAKINSQKKREKFLQWLMKLEWEIYGIPKPDLVIYLSVTPEMGQKLVDRKGKRKYTGKNQRDIHEENLVYLKKVEKVYLGLCRRFDYWEKVECLGKRGEILKTTEIQEKIIKVLKKKGIIKL